MQNLSRELVAAIGGSLEPKDRIALQQSARMFSSVHESKNFHQITIKRGERRDRLENLSEIARYVKKIKPNLDEFHFKFLNCDDVPDFDVSCLEDVTLSAMIVCCSCFEKILDNLSQVPLVFLFLGFSRECDVGNLASIQTKARSLEVYLHNQQLSLLEIREFAEKITYLTIDASECHVPFSTNFEHLKNVRVLRVFARHLDIEITDSKKITHLALLSSEIRSELSMIRTLSWILDAKNLQEIIAFDYDAQNASSDHFIWYRIASLLPKTTKYRFHAGSSSAILPFLCRMIDSAKLNPSNVSAFYISDSSYLTCLAIRVLMPEVRIEKFRHDSWPSAKYEPPEALSRLTTFAEIYEAMNSEQRFSWHFLSLL